MRRLSDEDCATIAKLISSFRGTITWSDVIALGEEATGQNYTRQSLENKDDIRTAYDLVRKSTGQDKQRHSNRPKSKELVKAEERIAKLVAEYKLVEDINAQLREQFVVWANNARKKGLTEADLNSPLPKLQRKSNARGQQ
jgi:hypothetical protein